LLGQPQLRPHPFEAVQGLPVHELGVQQPASAPLSTHSSPLGHLLHLPPQPLGWAHESGPQLGVHTHWPNWQLPASHGPAQQESRQVPFEQKNPASH
jgi:hypothetical protein